MAQSTYNLSDVFRALGVRDPKAIPNISAAQLLPVVVMGTFAAFAPEVIEARGFINQGPINLLAGQWLGLLHQSTAPGGTIVEQINCADGVRFNLAPTKPFTGGVVTPFTIGGQPVQSLFEDSGIQVGAFPQGGALGGSNTNAGMLYGTTVNPIEQIWVPPSWFFWSILIGAQPTAYVAWRFREIPESQGPA